MHPIAEHVRRCCWLSSVLAVAVAVPAQAADAIDTPLGPLTPIVDARLRFENVDPHSAAADAEALTARARLGFETAKVWDTTLLAEGEFTWSPDDHYDSTVNGHTAYPVVADPEGAELNRLQLSNTSIAGTTITLGRQRILLDDQRFVGNSGWRQNEQTFDALRLVNRSVENLTFDVAYVEQVNRVFGPESRQGRYNGDTVLANAAYRLPVGTLTAFAYRVDIDPIVGVPAAARDSSDTVGARFAGEHAIDKFTLGYTASYATQRDAGANPLHFDLDYYLAEISARYLQYSVGAGVEVLQGDGIKGFSTPLATLHKFQGWADKFLTTPANGIDDRYVNAGFARKRTGPLDALSVAVSYHWYDAERGSRAYGEELDAQVQARWHQFTAALKYADYRADTLFADTTKVWAQLEYVW